jgi:hypothetical protein
MKPTPACGACELVDADCIGGILQIKERKADRKRRRTPGQLQHHNRPPVTQNMVEYRRMTEVPDPKESERASQGGVFGNLPDARPGTRSPRRKTGGAKAKAKSATKPKAARQATPKKKTPPVPKAKPAAPPPRTEPKAPDPQQPGGLADVAWAGIAVAAEAATIGVRLASRAIEAVRGNPERD